MFIFVYFFCVSLIAQEESKRNSPEIQSESSFEKQLEIERLINKDLDQNMDLIEDKSHVLPAEQRYYIYKHHKKDAGVPFALNLFLGFGIGSFVQGDKTGGTISLVGDLVSVTVFYIGLYMMESKKDYGVITKVLNYSGLISLMTFRIFDIIRPWVYTESYNKKLEQSLRLAVGFIPVLNVTQNLGTSYGLALRACF